MAAPAIQYIRDRYGVPVVLGMRVWYDGKPGIVTGADPHLIITPEREEDRPYKSTRWRCHPTWRMEYTDPALDPAARTLAARAAATRAARAASRRHHQRHA